MQKVWRTRGHLLRKWELRITSSVTVKRGPVDDSAFAAQMGGTKEYFRCNDNEGNPNATEKRNAFAAQMGIHKLLQV